MQAPLHAFDQAIAARVQARSLAVVAMRGSVGRTPIELHVDVVGSM